MNCIVKKSNGFTLIELLVVVLIIGILAAVAVPQYNKAVEKSKTSQGISLVNTLGQAAVAYYMANGVYPTSLDQLDVGLTNEQKTQFWCDRDIQFECNKKEWGVALYSSSNNVAGITAWRTSGPYKGGGFAVYYTVGNTNLEANKLYCIERLTGVNQLATEQIYCVQLMKGTFVGYPTNNAHYAMP